MKLNKDAYKELIQGNVEYLKKHIPDIENHLEGRHILGILSWSIQVEYPTRVCRNTMCDYFDNHTEYKCNSPRDESGCRYIDNDCPHQYKSQLIEME